MEDYEALVKTLRNDSKRYCKSCPYFEGACLHRGKCERKAIWKAADAIEKLSTAHNEGREDTQCIH